MEAKSLPPASQSKQYECPKCRAFDIETKTLMGKIFSQDEQISLSIMLGQNIAATMARLKKSSPNNHLLQKDRTNLDYMSAIMAKFFVTLDDGNLSGVKAWIKRYGGVEFNRTDEACPHKGMSRWQRAVSWLALVRSRVANSLKR